MRRIWSVDLEKAGVSRGRQDMQMKAPAEVDPFTVPADTEPIREQRPIVQFRHYQLVGMPEGRIIVEAR